MRAEVSRLLDEGKTQQEVLDYFVAKYGSQEPLASPIDRGFNRLAWLLPYLLGASGFGMVAFAAVKWSRRQDPEPEAAPSAPREDPELQARLDDELRDLD
jgi:cytochrome c-type biogenesis protein CcmH